MKFILLFVFAGMAMANSLSPDWYEGAEEMTMLKQQSTTLGADFENIMQAQSQALDEIDNEDKQNSKVYNLSGLKFKSMKTDLGVSKSGLLGVSALKSSHGVEISWKQKSSNKDLNQIDDSEFLIDSSDDQDLKKTSIAIAEVVKKSGKVKNTRYLERNVMNALNKVKYNLDLMHVSQYKRWKLDGIRLDLKFDVNGKVWFFAKAGVKFRVRIDWKITEKILAGSNKALSNSQTRFVAKTLADLNKSMERVSLPSFYLKRINIGVGASRKAGFFGIWKYSAGFLGFLRFVPVPGHTSIVKSSIEFPEQLLEEPYALGGETEDLVTAKGWRFWRVFIPRKKFRSGMSKTMNTSAYLIEKANNIKNKNWYISGLKTSSSVSRSGFFGLSSVSTTGVIELELNRI